MNPKTKIAELVNNFKNENAWDRSEEHIQTMFTVKLLDLLGFNSSNMRINQGQEVKTGKKPDILLYNNSGNTILVIESKDASKADMLDGRYQNKTFIEQLNGYCSAEGIFWGVLTNFIEWRIYSIYQNRLYKDKKYAFHDILWNNANKNNYVNLLSDDGIKFFDLLSNSFLVTSKGRIDDDPVYYPQQEEIKEQFFQDLKSWRSIIRNYISKNYSNKYDIDIIDLMTQKLLDRLIFIDYCADNNIITQDRLHAILHSKGNIYNELARIFKDMDEKFNSELFSPNECDQIIIDDDVIRPIISELSNTDFSKLSVHVIGEVYENYLGELLKSNKRGVKVEESKVTQKKKSQGIYYTPDYIVNYLVENTVGEILSKCKNENEISKIKVLDPACGSGSFLIRVFDEFLKHYKRVNKEGKLFEFETRKMILQNNIYGVDLDERAVEISKLNLLVKALEGSAHYSLSGRKLLPNLKLNIRCGNSLIGGEGSKDEMGLFWKEHLKDITSLKKLRLDFNTNLDDLKQSNIYLNIQVAEESINAKLNHDLEIYYNNIDDIKPFNYSITFPEVFENDGFDCIVGNPPWGADLDDKSLSLLVKKYSFLKIKNKDSYFYFILKSLDLLKNTGTFGMIVPNTWLLINNAAGFRELLLKNKIKEIIDHGDGVFRDAIVESSTIVLKKNNSSNYKCHVKRIKKGKVILDQNVNIKNWLVDEYKRITLEINDDFITIFNKARINSENFSINCEIIFGIKPYQVGHGTPPQTKDMLENRIYHSDSQKNDKWKPLLVGSDVNRYEIDYKDNQFIKYGKWLMYPSDETKILSDKVLLRRTSDKIRASLDLKNYYPQNSIFIITSKKYSNKYILGLLNSKLFDYLYKHLCPQQGKIFAEVKPSIIKSLPIHIPNSKEIKIINNIESNVIDILTLSQSIKSREKNKVKILSLDSEIDKLVYQLYSLTDDDINIIENISIV